MTAGVSPYSHGWTTGVLFDLFWTPAFVPQGEASRWPKARLRARGDGGERVESVGAPVSMRVRGSVRYFSTTQMRPSPDAWVSTGPKRPATRQRNVPSQGRRRSYSRLSMSSDTTGTSESMARTSRW